MLIYDSSSGRLTLDTLQRQHSNCTLYITWNDADICCTRRIQASFRFSRNQLETRFMKLCRIHSGCLCCLYSLRVIPGCDRLISPLAIRVTLHRSYRRASIETLWGLRVTNRWMKPHRTRGFHKFVVVLSRLTTLGMTPRNIDAKIFDSSILRSLGRPPNLALSHSFSSSW